MLNKVLISVFFTITMLIADAGLFAQVSALDGKDTSAKVAPVPAVKEDNSAGLKSKVIYTARDSIRFDVAEQKVYLFGEAKVTYETMVLNADYIEFDMSKDIAYSRGARDTAGKVLLDSLGLPIGDPVFADGGKSFDAKELTYNFHTKKGKIRDVTTKEGDAYIHARDAKKDTGDIYYIKNGRYTTCDLQNPHFYLKATKIKIIPDDKIIIGPAYLSVGDVPTPLGLPFGVFPNKKGRKSGVLIPAYGESDLGYFLKDGGYYFGFSDYFDVALRGDFYSKGSFAVRTNTNYVKRYKYKGFLGISTSQIQLSEPEFPDYSKSHDFFIKWQHSQDPKSNPTSRFSANVNAGSSNYQKYNASNANDYLSNSFNSNIAWNKSWPGKPFNFSLNLAQSQTKRARADHKGSESVVDLTLPEAAFTVARQYPLKRKNNMGKQNVFEKIGMSGSLTAKNQVTTYDTLLFKPNSAEFQPGAKRLFRNGLKGTIPISTSMNAGPVIITPSVNVNSYGYFQTYRKRLDTAKNVIVTDTVNGFKGAYDYNAALTFSTKLYGMYAFKNFKVKAVRHVLTPTASFSYRPDYGQMKYGYYDSVLTSKTDDNKLLYSYFENGIYGYPGAGKSGFINFGFNNNLEMKVRPSRKDTSSQDRKIVLIENLSITSGYNLSADHFQWSNINVSGRTKIFKQIDLTLVGVIDPYVYNDSLKKRVERFEYDRNGHIGRLTSAALSLSTSLKSLVKKKDEKAKTSNVKRPATYGDELGYVQLHPEYYVDFNVPWDLTVNYNLVYLKPTVRDTVIQSLAFSGNLSVTSKWKVGFHSGFDFIRKDFTFTSFDVYRDLHCWEMRLNWIPFGFRKSYMLTIAVKASVLQDLKLSRKRDWYDTN